MSYKTEDDTIIDMLFERSQQALTELESKYGKYCYNIAFNVLRSQEDSEECTNDVYMKVWNSIPPEKPHNLKAFLAKISRNAALDIYDREKAVKRGGETVPLILDELAECIPSSDEIKSIEDSIIISDALTQFLKTLPEHTRTVFIQRYWYACTVKEIAELHNMKESKTKMILHRTRNKLKEYLEKEGIEI